MFHTQYCRGEKVEHSALTSM